MGHLPEQGIPQRMAQGVVHLLEAVQVQEVQREAIRLAPLGFDSLAESGLEEPPIG